MSVVSSTCSESSAQTLFNQRLLDRLKLKAQQKREEAQDPLKATAKSDKERPESASQSQSISATRQATEPNKGQFLDFHA